MKDDVRGGAAGIERGEGSTKDRLNCEGADNEISASFKPGEKTNFFTVTQLSSSPNIRTPLH